MYRVSIPSDEQAFAQYYHFRWLMLRKPWNFPEGSEKDAYETVSEHRMILNTEQQVVAVGRVHLNTQEEAQIRHIAVHPDCREQGVGKLMVTALEDVAMGLGAERVVTNSLDTSIAFFKSCDYELDKQVAEELDKQRRQQMVKKLADRSAVRMHPNWCQQLQDTWHETIPISEQMGIKLHQYTGNTLEARASLNKNINLHGSMFAGSIYSLATLTGWGMIFLQLKQRGLPGDIVLGDGNIHYHKPVTQQPRAICNIETLDGNFNRVERNQKCRLKLQVNIKDGDRPVAEFMGTYWVLPKKASE